MSTIPRLHLVRDRHRLVFDTSSRKAWRSAEQVRLVHEVEAQFRFADRELGHAWLALHFFGRSEADADLIFPPTIPKDRWEFLSARGQRQGLTAWIGAMHAKSFISSLVMVRSVLTQLIHIAASHAFAHVASGQRDRLDAAVPHLKDVRDSIQHADERVRGRYKPASSRPIPVSPPQMLETPQIKGEAMIHGVLMDGDLYRFTLPADGTQAAIPIRESTLEATQDCIQSAVDGAPWVSWDVLE